MQEIEMEEIKNKNCALINRIIVAMASVLVLLFGMFFDEVNQFIAGGVLVAGAVGIYFLAVLKTAEKDK